MKLHIKAEHYLNEKIARGDSNDNIPSVLTSDQWSIDKSNGVKPKKQSPLKADRAEQFILKGFDACQTDEERKHWNRNETLISFEKIPLEIVQEIINKYKQEKPKNKMKLFNYLVANNMKELLNEVDHF